MAPLEQIPLYPITSDRTYPTLRNHTNTATDRYRGSQRYTATRTLEQGIQALSVDPMKELNEKTAHILYYNLHSTIGPEGGKLHSEAHKHSEAGPLLAKYEPRSQIAPAQLKMILQHLRPAVRTTGDTGLTALCEFVKTLLVLKKAWFKAAGGFFGLLAYMDMCETWGIEGGGPSFPGQHGLELIQWQLGKTQERHENTYKALKAFKSAPAFMENIRQLYVWFEKLQVEGRECRVRTEEKLKKMEEERLKRNAVKRRNEQQLTRQMGQGWHIWGMGFSSMWWT